MSQFTLCEDTGMLAVDGACPAHRGDACLREFVPFEPRTNVNLNCEGCGAPNVVTLNLQVLCRACQAMAE